MDDSQWNLGNYLNPTASVKAKLLENARLTFDYVVNDTIQELIDTNFKFYKKITDDAHFAKYFLDLMFERYQKQDEHHEHGNVA